ncbi:MAG TPA: hypothetical protein VLA68_05270 [Nitrososphaera sp.]|nr:hypothetical protein [Nitrososphaera sp.]HEX2014621.1 hypothetical protein [Nitrososphaera sp.]
MVNDTAEEKDFRERYALELRKKRVNQSLSPHFGYDELSDEIRKVRRQELATPGRRGEQIKSEEIIKEIMRRLDLGHHASKAQAGH